MRINRSDLDDVLREYNPDHDLGPEAPVHWSVGKLADMIERLVEVIEKQDERLKLLGGRDGLDHQRLLTLEGGYHRH